jgi:hypothetical protein
VCDRGGSATVSQARDPGVGELPIWEKKTFSDESLVDIPAFLLSHELARFSDRVAGNQELVILGWRS